MTKKTNIERETEERAFEAAVREQVQTRISELDQMVKDIQDKFNAARVQADKQLNGLIAQALGGIEQKEAKLNQLLNGLVSVKSLKIEQKDPSEGENKEVIVHERFDTVLNILKSQKRSYKNVMLVGPAGSGKTHMVSMVAEALGLKYYPMSVGLQTTKSDLMGFISATGNYITTPVREAFEKGGVLLLDEFDAGHAGVITILNTLLSNEVVSFPDGQVRKHKSFIAMTACNTYGRGGNEDYIGRNKLDAATLDRFVTVNMGYDENLEAALVNNDEVMARIKSLRRKAVDMAINVVISPRASMNAADLLNAGFTMEDALEMTVFKGMSADIRSKLD